MQANVAPNAVYYSPEVSVYEPHFVRTLTDASYPIHLLPFPLIPRHPVSLTLYTISTTFIANDIKRLGTLGARGNLEFCWSLGLILRFYSLKGLRLWSKPWAYNPFRFVNISSLNYPILTLNIKPSNLSLLPSSVCQERPDLFPTALSVPLPFILSCHPYSLLSPLCPPPLPLSLQACLLNLFLTLILILIL